MWLGAVDFRVAGERANIKELEAACALVDLMIHSEQVDSWFVFEDFFTKLIGVADSMTFIHLYQILQHSGILITHTIVVLQNLLFSSPILFSLREVDTD